MRVSLSYRWMHADLAIPRKVIAEAGGPAAEALGVLGEGEWVVLGWGDEDYYRERGMTAARLLDFARSMLEPNSPSVVELDPEPQAPTPESSGKAVLALELSEEGARALVERLNASFALRDGHPVAAGRGRDPGSQFFLGHARSDLAQNCNHWVADLLHAAGVPSDGLLNTASPGLALSLTWLADAQEVPGDADAHIGGAETPPSHSGRFEPISGAPELTDADLVFEGYAVGLGRAVLRTVPLDLVEAGRSGLSEALDVRPDSLVGIRRIERIEGAPGDVAVCEGQAPRHLAIGFAPNDGGPYEIALAAYSDDPRAAGARPCAAARYRQP
ncbi:DUF2459 domain-containing protein [Parvularcula oceani]|uniref:DUF2459 domain-containing protein n=1 Tax=Parvularcula oceani TaxID=1247963 RepID=UPI0012DBEAB9|nr:DUF2459 domain-containing protein [Parvularcula oceani]